MGASRRARLLTGAAVLLLLAIISLAIGIEGEKQCDPVRMRRRSAAIFFGIPVFHSTPAPLPFATRFPDAVAGRDGESYWAGGSRKGLFRRLYVTSQSWRSVNHAQGLIAAVELAEMPEDEATRWAKRVIDLIVAREEFRIEYDDTELRILDARDSILERWPMPP